MTLLEVRAILRTRSSCSTQMAAAKKVQWSQVLTARSWNSRKISSFKLLFRDITKYPLKSLVINFLQIFGVLCFYELQPSYVVITLLKRVWLHEPSILSSQADTSWVLQCPHCRGTPRQLGEKLVPPLCVNTSARWQLEQDIQIFNQRQLRNCEIKILFLSSQHCYNMQCSQETISFCPFLMMIMLIASIETLEKVRTIRIFLGTFPSMTLSRSSNSSNVTFHRITNQKLKWRQEGNRKIETNQKPNPSHQVLQDPKIQWWLGKLPGVHCGQHYKHVLAEHTI